MPISRTLQKIKGRKEIRWPFSKIWEKGKKRGVSLVPMFFSHERQGANCLNEQKLRAARPMNRFALSKWKAGILQTAATTEGLELRGWGHLYWEGWWCMWGRHLHLKPTLSRCLEHSRQLQQQCGLWTQRTSPTPVLLLQCQCRICHYLSLWVFFRGNSNCGHSCTSLCGWWPTSLVSFGSSKAFPVLLPDFMFPFSVLGQQWIVGLLLTPYSPWGS